MGERSIVTIGNFDGVHIGHRQILAQARLLGDRHGAAVVALTFEPHPATVLRPDAVPARLSSAAEKVQLLREAGVDVVSVLEPTAGLLALDPATFIGQVVDRHRPLAIVEGRDFRFGRQRAGQITVLEQLGRALSFAVVAVEPVEVKLTDWAVVPAGSSLLRWLLGQGRVADATLCLGRPFALSAIVVAGERRGRTIGVPTANLDEADLAGRILPADGVYAGWANLPGGSARPTAISVGPKPTFDGGRRCVESHLLDHHGDLYGQRLTVQFTRWLREQRPFPSIGALCGQLARDIAAVRQLHERGHMAVRGPAGGAPQVEGAAAW